MFSMSWSCLAPENFATCTPFLKRKNAGEPVTPNMSRPIFTVYAFSLPLMYAKRASVYFAAHSL